MQKRYCIEGTKNLLKNIFLKEKEVRIKAVLKGNKSSGKRDKQEKSYIPNKQGKFADITDDLL